MSAIRNYLILSLLSIFVVSGLFAQQNVNEPQKFALVIGNANYSNFGTLRNPANDANDMAATLQNLGFAVDRVINGNLRQMEAATVALRNRLAVAGNNAYGFFFYAGHGVQMDGQNYLIPVDAVIPDRAFLRERALSVQVLLDMMNDAKNALNIVVLDACRDFPASWNRTVGRGLALVNPPADSIIVYATSAGSVAADGMGRNGLFTEHLLNNLATPGLEVQEIFRRTGADVARVSNRTQIPAVYNQFFDIAVLNPAHSAAEAAPPVSAPVAESPPPVTKAPVQAVQPAPLPAPGRQRVSPQKPQREIAEQDKAGRLNTLGVSLGSAFSAPYLIGTMRGTFAPFDYTFAELGLDIGALNKYENTKGYYSLFPYLHFNFFMPFKFSGKQSKGGWYAGMGAGYMFSRYYFKESSDEQRYLSGEPASYKTFTGNAVAGVNIADMLDVSFTVRTNFKSASNKLSLGYTYRFK